MTNPLRIIREWLMGSNTRSLDAAAGGRRWRDDRSNRDIASALHGGAATVAQRGAHFALNTPEGTRITESLVGNLVGTGITPRPQHPSPAIRDFLASGFLGWTDLADVDGRQDFFGLQGALVRDMAAFGEGLAFLGNDRQGVPQLRRLHPDQLDRSKTQNLQSGARIQQGVEFDAAGKIVAYWIRPGAPGEALAGISLSSNRFPASNIIHMFRPLVPGQVRGLSWFAPILLSGHDLDSLLDAMLVRAKVGAMFVGSLYDPDGTAGGLDGEQNDSTLDTTAEPGTIRVEANGSRLDWSEPPDSGDTIGFAKGIQRRLAIGAGVTYEQATGDYSQTNYSSARAALLEFRRFAQGVQHHTIVHQLCRPVWNAVIRWQVLSGAVSAAAYQRQRMQFHAVKWLPPAWAWVDPEKDAKAVILEMDNNIRSRAEVVSERGYDIEALDREIAADQERARRLNITPQDADHASA